MKVDITLSPLANVLAAINAANPNLKATASQVTLGTPYADAGNGGRNTAVVMTAILDAGFSGSNTYHYTRRGLAAGQAIATSKAVPMEILRADTDAGLLTKIAGLLGLVESEISLANIVRPADANTPGSVDVVAKATSLLYTGTFAATLTDSEQVPLSEAAPNTNLGGFDIEA